MNKFLLSISLLLAFNLSALAQSYEEMRLELDKWHPGEVMLRDGTSVEGDINFNYLIDMIKVRKDGKLNTYNHKQILGFAVFKEEENRTVQYKSLNLPIGDKIYEVVGEDDEKALLVTNVIDREMETEFTGMGIYNQRYRYSALPPTPGTPGTRTFSINRKAEVFYIIRNTGEIDEIGKIVITRDNRGMLKASIKKKKLISILKEFDPGIEQYIEDNDINLKRRDDLIKAILSVMDTDE
jgi:hypothetical protein